MEKAKQSLRFEAEVGNDGRITFSKSVHGLGVKAGSKVMVKIVGGVLSRHLTRLRVTDEEIELIGNTQLEDREHVVSFLASQGALKGNTRFSRRLKKRLL